MKEKKVCKKKELKKKEPKKTEKSIFNRKIRCGCCGKKMRIRMGVKSKRITCHTSSVSDKYGCMKGGIQEEEVKQAVLSMVNYQVQLISNLLEILEDKGKSIHARSSAKEIERFGNRMEELKNKKFFLYEEYVEGRLTKEEYQKEVKTLSGEISYYAECKERMVKQNEEEKYWEGLQKDKQLRKIKSLGKIEKLNSEIVDCMIDTIYIYDVNKIEVQWAFRDIYVGATEK